MVPLYVTLPGFILYDKFAELLIFDELTCSIICDPFWENPTKPRVGANFFSSYLQVL